MIIELFKNGMTIIWDAWDDVDDKKSNYTMPETDETLGKEIGMFLNQSFSSKESSSL